MVLASGAGGAMMAGYLAVRHHLTQGVLSPCPQPLRASCAGLAPKPIAQSAAMRPAKKTTGIKQLPDELLVCVVHKLPPEDYKNLRLVDRQFSRVASDGLAQGRAFAPKLLVPLAALHRAHGTIQHLTEGHEHRVAQCATALLRRDTPPKGAAASWLQLVQQADYIREMSCTHARILRVRAAFTPSIWSGIMLGFIGGLMLSSFLCDQGTVNDCPELVTLGAFTTLLTLLFAACSPLFWLVYNLLGLAAEEATAYYGARLHQALSGPCADIDTLLKEGLRPAATL